MPLNDVEKSTSSSSPGNAFESFKTGAKPGCSFGNGDVVELEGFAVDLACVGELPRTLEKNLGPPKVLGLNCIQKM